MRKGTLQPSGPCSPGRGSRGCHPWVCALGSLQSCINAISLAQPRHAKFFLGRGNQDLEGGGELSKGCPPSQIQASSALAAQLPSARRELACQLKAVADSVCKAGVGFVAGSQVVNKHSKKMLLLRARLCMSSKLVLCGRGTPLADPHQAPLQFPVQMLPWRELRMPE